MTDRKLLELAAKAAGIAATFDDELGDMFVYGDRSPEMSRYWNPLTDDGDALRLAVKLSIDIEHQCPGVEAYRSFYHEDYKGGGQKVYGEEDDDDPCAATRRAIVRCAAELGKAMP
jgi:hypothetical protein